MHLDVLLKCCTYFISIFFHIDMPILASPIVLTFGCQLQKYSDNRFKVISAQTFFSQLLPNRVKQKNTNHIYNGSNQSFPVPFKQPRWLSSNPTFFWQTLLKLISRILQLKFFLKDLFILTVCHFSIDQTIVAQKLSNIRLHEKWSRVTVGGQPAMKKLNGNVFIS